LIGTNWWDVWAWLGGHSAVAIIGALLPREIDHGWLAPGLWVIVAKPQEAEAAFPVVVRPRLSAWPENFALFSVVTRYGVIPIRRMFPSAFLPPEASLEIKT